ncbi:hypothetical protein CR513_18776, partial [Mucuna pruriens]
MGDVGDSKVQAKEVNISKQGNKRFKGGNKRFDKKKMQCNACQKYGHFVDECWHKKEGQKRNDDEVHIVVDDEGVKRKVKFIDNSVVIGRSWQDEKGFSMKLKCSVLNVCDEKQILIMRDLISTNRTLEINLQIVDPQCLATGVENDNCCVILGMNLYQLRKDDMVIGFPLIKPPKKVCQGCMLGKQPKKVFKSYAQQRETEAL